MVRRRRGPRPRRVDWTAAWEFVLALAEVDTQVVFLDYKRQKYLHRAAKAAGADEDTIREMLQYPRGSYARRGLVRHYPGHEKHFHPRHFGYSLSGGTMRIVDGSGTRDAELPTGSSFYSEGVKWHEGLNIGETPVQYLMIEPK